MSARLTSVRLPLQLDGLGFADPAALGGTTVVTGPPAWAWDGTAPELPITVIDHVDGGELPGWGVDHVVLLVPEIEAAVGVIRDGGASLRLRMEVRGRPTAFFRVGTVLEVIETGVPAPLLYGVALVTEEPLGEVATRWRSAGRDVSDPRPAIQPGRSILTVRDAGAGLAVMSPKAAVPSADPTEGDLAHTRKKP